MTYSQFRKEQKSFQSEQGNIKYMDQGEGEVVLLLHGIPTSGWLYRKMMDPLADNYRLIIPDMLGFGSSDSPKGYDLYAPPNHAQRLLELMAYLNIRSWHHVLHDAGGLWTWELMKLNPSCIKSLTILNTIIFEEGFKPPIRFTKGFIAKCVMAMYSNGIATNTMLKGLFKSGLVKNNLSKEELSGYKKPLLEGKTKAMYHFFSNTCNDLPDYGNVIDDIRVPAQIIWGIHDTFLLINKIKDTLVSRMRLKNEDVHLIDAKHFIQEEKPDEIVFLINRFIGSETTS